MSAIALCLAGCALPDYGDTPFLCGEDGACPQGYQCIRLECWRLGSMSIDAATISLDAKPDGSRADAEPDASRPDAVIDASIDAAVDAATGNGNKYDPCGRNSDCRPDLCCDSELYQCLIRAIARCMP
jgi:hypothetical protein